MAITHRLAALVALAVVFSQPSFAQAPPSRLRGTVVSLAGDTLVLNANDGQNMSITLAPDVTYRSITKATLADIKPGSGIGIVSQGPANKQEAVAIQIFMPGAPFRQVQLGWDMMPESTMTNGVVEGQAVATGGGHLKVTVDGKPVEMTIAPNVSIGAAGPGDKSLVTQGAKAVVFASKTGDTYTGRTVIIGKDGVTPPL